VLDKNLNVINKIEMGCRIAHIKQFEDWVLASSPNNFYILDSELRLVKKLSFDIGNFTFCGFSFDGLRIYAVSDSNLKRWVSKIVLDFLLPLKKRIEKLKGIRWHRDRYEEAKRLLLQLKLTEFDKLFERIGDPDTIISAIKSNVSELEEVLTEMISVAKDKGFDYETDAIELFDKAIKSAEKSLQRSESDSRIFGVIREH